MSGGRYFFVIGLGLATYLVASDAPVPEAPPAPIASVRAPAPSPAPVVQAPVVQAPIIPAPPPPRTGPTETELALMSQLQRLNAQVEALSLQLVELSRQRAAPEQTAAVQRPAPRRAPEGRIDPVLGAAPVKQPRPPAVDQSAVLELAKVTELLMQRIEKLERE